MKNLLLMVLLILTVSLLVSHALSVSAENGIDSGVRDTQGTLTFTVRTVTYNGQYAPRNAGAIWITNSQNQFVKTVKVWASQYRYTLVRWNGSSGGNTTGAVTGASLNNHVLHTVTWNGANYQGTQMPDGVYNINVEFTEHNASASNLGKFKQVSFTKGPDPVNQTLPNEQYFRDLSVVWAPVVQNGILFGSVTNGQGAPISGALIQAGAYSVTTTATGAYEMSLPPGTYDLSCSAGGYVTQTATGITVQSNLTLEQNFVLSVVDASDDLNTPGALLLRPASPNPFGSETRLEYLAKGVQPVRIEIFNQRGQRILQTQMQPAKGDWNAFVWDGRASSGTRCPVGTYLIRISQGAHSALSRAQLLN